MGSSGTPFVDLLLQQLLGGQVELVLTRFGRPAGCLRQSICAALRWLGEVLADVRQGEFEDGSFGGFAEEEADGGVFLRELHLAVIEI